MDLFLFPSLFCHKSSLCKSETEYRKLINKVCIDGLILFLYQKPRKEIILLEEQKRTRRTEEASLLTLSVLLQQSEFSRGQRDPFVLAVHGVSGSARHSQDTHSCKDGGGDGGRGHLHGKTAENKLH